MAPLARNFEGFRRRFGIEIGAVLGSHPPDVVPGEAGRPRREYTPRLVEESGHDVPDGTPGELWVRPDSPCLTPHLYHGLPQKTAETIRRCARCFVVVRPVPPTSHGTRAAYDCRSCA